MSSDGISEETSEDSHMVEVLEIEYIESPNTKADIGLQSDREKGQEKQLTGEISQAESRQSLMALADRVAMVFFEADASGMLTYLSPAWERLTGRHSSEALGCGWMSFLHPDDCKRLEGQGDDAFSKWTASSLSRLRAADGTYRWIHARTSLIPGRTGLNWHWIGTLTDVEEMIAAQEASRRDHAEWEKIFQSMSDWVSLISPEGEVLRTNGAEKFLGIDSDQIVGVHCFKLVHGTDHIIEGCPLQKMLHSRRRETAEVQTPDGKRWLLVTVDPLQDCNGEIVSAVHLVRDITEHKRGEEAILKAEEKYRNIFEASQEGIFQTTPGGRCLTANPALAQMLGYSSPDELISRGTDLARQAYVDPGEWDQIKALLEAHGSVRNLEVRLRRSDETEIWASISAKAVRGRDGEILYYEGTACDITDKKRSEEMLTASLREKETMLKEIHHRVKNNLQVISSLLSLQSRSIKDKAAIEAFSESHDRIRSMALIHEKLYRSENLSRVDIQDYIRSLANDVIRSYGIEERTRLKFEMDEVFLGIDKAIPCGLIARELITNCAKHAFPDGREGEIKIDLIQGEGEVEFVVSDDGVGLPNGFDIKSGSSLGLMLVRSLVDQLRGTIDLCSFKGTVCRVRFAAS